MMAARIRAPMPDFRATLLLLAGILTAPIAATGDTPAGLAHSYAIWVGLGILASVAADYRGTYRNLIRADLMAIGSFYFLTLFEFLFPQPGFNDLVGLEETRTALLACSAGFAGLAIGRHLAPLPARSLERVLQANVSPRALITLFTASLFGAYFYMLAAVDFSVTSLIDYFMAPRFSQPWGRGRFGDWRALLGEIGLVIYLIPPVAGIVLARRSEFSAAHKLYVAAGFLFTLFYGFSSGTRNIFVTFLATFLVAYAFATARERKREFIAVVSIVSAMTLAATVVMLDFRNIGFSNYLRGYREHAAEKEQQFFVDYNLYVIAKLTEVFPRQQDFLGLEIPYIAIIRPVPRALWPGKPQGLSISIEDAVGVEGLTLASSFAGEAYMSGGMLGVFLAGLVFGFINGWWNRFGRPDNSALGHLIFASGFFAAVISMRSMFVFTTAILPTLAALALAHALLDRYRTRRTHPPPEHV